MTDAQALRGALGTLHEIARSLDSGEDARARLVHALELTRRLVPCSRCALLELRGKADQRLIVVPTAPAEEMERLRHKLSSLLALITEDEEPAATNGHFRADAAMTAHLALPVTGVDRIIGVLYVERGSDEPFGENNLNLLSLAAAHLGGYLGTLQSLRRESESAVSLVQTRDSIQRLVARITDDLRNALTAIGSGADILSEQITAADAKKTSARIATNAQHCARLIDDMLEMVRLQTTTSLSVVLDTADVVSAVAFAVEEYQSLYPDRAFELRTPQEPLLHEIDPDQLAHAVSNLLSNAVRYGSPRDPVRIAVERHPQSVMISVHNRGPAIAADLIPTLFDPFERRRRATSRELGVGLYVVCEIVRGHSGTVRVTSRVPEGTTFTIVLPSR